jgi:transposase
VFLPLTHPPGEAQVDFGEATVKLTGELTKVALFVMTLPYSGAIFIQAFSRECTETFLEGHRRAFEYFGGVPRRISYDNSAIAVIEVLSGRVRIARLFRLAKQSVDRELGATDRAEVEHTVRPATAAQLRALHAIANRQQLDLAAEIESRFGMKCPNDLYLEQASQLIDVIKPSANGSAIEK